MRLLAAMLWLALVVAARAGDLPAAGSPSVPGIARGESHAWVALPLPSGGSVILHLPPRRAADRTDTINDAADGGVRQALRLPEMPERLAAWGNQLWIAFEPVAGEGRRVLTMTVERSALGGAWSSPESEGRLPSLPQLPGDRTLAGLAGTVAGPVALLWDERFETVTLVRLRGNEWAAMGLPVELTQDLAAAHAPPLLVSDAGGIGLALPGSGILWRGAMQGRGGESAAVSWGRSALSFHTGDGLVAPIPDTPIVASGRQMVYASYGSGGGAELWTTDSVSAHRLVAIAGVSATRALVPLDQVGRIALVWIEPGRPAPGQQGSGLTTRICEVSAQTGAVLFQGPARVAGPVSAAELKFLAVVLVGVMVLVLLFVLKPDQSGRPLSLPAGLALAEPGRRIIAAAIDLIVALIGTGLILGVPARELLSPGLLMYDPAGMQTFATIVGVGIVHSATAEWLLGASIGKLLTGCRVVRVVHRADATLTVARPGPLRALVRNVVRWTLAPIAIAGMNAPDHRHRGDLAAGTVVVVRIAAGPS